MSLCLHYCEEYKVRHSHRCIANWQQEELNQILFALSEKHIQCCDDFWFNDDDLSASSYVEISKAVVKDIIPDLLIAGDEWSDALPTDDHILQRYMSELGQADVTPRTLAHFLTDALENAEPTTDFIRFEWV